MGSDRQRGGVSLDRMVRESFAEKVAGDTNNEKAIETWSRKGVPRRQRSCAKALRQGQPWGVHRLERGDATSF